VMTMSITVYFALKLIGYVFVSEGAG